MCLHELFEEQARRSPQALAVEDTRTRLTYEELDRRADLLASYHEGGWRRSRRARGRIHGAARRVRGRVPRGPEGRGRVPRPGARLPARPAAGRRRRRRPLPGPYAAAIRGEPARGDGAPLP